MTAGMVKHTGESKGYWFEAPNSLADKIQPGTHVICDTAIGQQRGKVIGTLISNGEDEAKEIMTSAGAKFPLRKVTAVECHVPIEEIKVPSYLTHSTPSEDKIVKRFLEYYHTGRFNTKVTVDDDGVLTEGYTAYKVAKLLHLTYLIVVIKG